ncbi:MAG: NFACT RNA binding domain-containing protein, partial [Acidobacteriota bacterium]|nr:NFACT RNA binding domain-containing protein [Acidobacteriota bacterium]
EAHERGEFDTLSESLDFYYTEKDRADNFRSVANSAKSSIRNDIKKQKRLKKALAADLKRHGEPEKWKRLGDLVNANISTARREGDIAFLTDYFDEKLPEIEIEIEENTSLTDASEKFYKKYSKSKNAKAEIEKRLATVDLFIEQLTLKMEKLDLAIDTGDIDAVGSFLAKKKGRKSKFKSKQSDVSKYAREYTSSDGLPILVGKRSKDNDYLTFRIARSLDMWFHAADYPGSHVIIRRRGRAEIPQQTILEAARLAAFYSKAKNESKAAVRYTEKKFVNKPKGAAPGLVSLASSKTLVVVPGIPAFGKH